LKRKKSGWRVQKQIELCKITPQDGMVAYATADRYYGEESAKACGPPAAKDLSLPSLSQMQVKTSVHESVLIRSSRICRWACIDAFPTPVPRHRQVRRRLPEQAVFLVRTPKSIKRSSPSTNPSSV
jgi:hypothetical protein